MVGEKRRKMIIEDIKKSGKPISGAELAKRYDVSRQVIVQDVALLRAAGYDVMSTTRGYVINQASSYTRTFYVKHNDDRINEELNLIVDLGGRVIDVIVEHHIYGRLSAELNVSSRRDVENFMKKLLSGEATPLNHLTCGEHQHTVEAESIDILDIIEKDLKSKGFLSSKTDY